MKVTLKFNQASKDAFTKLEGAEHLPSFFSYKLKEMGLDVEDEISPSPESMHDDFYIKITDPKTKIGTRGSEIVIDHERETITLWGARHSLHYSDITVYFSAILAEKDNLVAIQYDTHTPSYAWWEVDCAPREQDIALIEETRRKVLADLEAINFSLAGSMRQHNLAKIAKKYGDFFIIYDIFDSAILNYNDETYQCDIRAALDKLFTYEEYGKFLENRDGEGVPRPLTDEQIEKISKPLQDAVTESFYKRSQRYIKWLASKEAKPTTWEELERFALEDGLVIGRDYIDEDDGVLEYNDGHCFLEAFYAHGIERARFNSLRDAGKTDQEALEIIIGF